MQPDLTVVGYISEGDGLGRQTVELLDQFGSEMKVNFVPTRKEKGSKIPERFQRYLAKKKPNWGKVIVLEDMLWRPGKDYYKKILSSNRKKSTRIAYSVWESTKIPQKWVEVLNEHFDVCVVPSSFLVQVYKDCGVKIPIFELPLGLNLDRFLAQPIKKKANTPFVFANFSACSERKNQALLVRAFAKAFGNDPSVMLRINSRYGESYVKEAIEKEIHDHNLENVILTQNALSQEEYLEAFKSIDCYVSPSKGEGFSIQPREAMALGIPVIATNNTGQEDLAKSGLILSIPCRHLSKAYFPWGESYGEYYECEEEALVIALKDAYENYSRHLSQAESCRNWSKQFQIQHLSKAYQNMFQNNSDCQSNFKSNSEGL